MIKGSISKSFKVRIVFSLAILLGVFSFFQFANAAGKMKLNKSKATLTVGNKVQLKIKNATKKTKVKWSTNKKKIVSVSKKGIVTAKKKGEAKVYAKIKGKTYTCKITVKEKAKAKKPVDNIQDNTSSTTTESTNKDNPSTNNSETTNNKKEETQKNNDSIKETPNTTEQETEPTPDNKVVLKSLSSKYTEAIVEKGGWTDATDLARQVRLNRNYSDGTSKVIDEFENPGVYKTDFDIDTAGEYKVTLSCSGDKGTNISTSINVSVCEPQENDDYKYISNGRIAKILGYKGESDTIVIPEKIDGAEVIGGFVLDGFDAKSISIPKGWRSFYAAPLFQACKQLEEIIVDEDNEYYSSLDGVLFDKSQKVLWRYPINKQSEEYNIPETVTDIAQGGFYECKNIKKVFIPKSVTVISKYLYYAIGTFDGGSLEEFVVDDDNPVFKSEDGVLFTDYLKWDEDKWNMEKGSSGDYVRVYTLICYPPSKKDVCYEIPSGVTGARGMNANQFLKKLIVPSSFTWWSNFYPFAGMEDISVCFDFEKLTYEQENGGTSVIAGLFEAGSGTIYVRSDDVKNKVKELMREEYGDFGTRPWVLSDDYNWDKTAE